MSRIDNDQFNINLEKFNPQKTVQIVCDVMQFQMEQKKLNLEIITSPNVPEFITSDEKRFS